LTPCRNEYADSPVIGVMLMIALVIVLAALVLLLALQLPNLAYDPTVPCIFQITKIRHTDTNGVLNYDSYMVIQNSGEIAYDNRKLSAKTYRNGQHLPCDLPTLNGNEYIPTHHFWIQNMGGFGTQGFLWYPGATIYINFAHGTFRPEDTVVFEVYDRATGQLISRDTWPDTNGNTEKWMRLYFNHRGA
jgi:hypothetical protein